MLLNHGRFNEKAKGQQLKEEEVRARRGVVCDRRGRELAVNLELESLYVDPLEVESPEESASRVSALTGRPEKAVLNKFSGSGRFVWVERKLDPAVAQRVREAKISGIGFVPDAKRYYPKDNLAAHILGFVDVDNRGMEGVELKYNDQLRGHGGTVVFSRDARGRKLSKGVEMESKGRNVLLTIDEGLQYMVEAELEKALGQWQASAATAIMMEPSTGEVLALANLPSYNPNRPGGSGPNERRNRAITDCYEPGSTFKIIVGTAAIEEGIVSLDTPFDCSRGAIEVGGRAIHDAHRHGVLPFREVIQKSSNVGSVMIGMRLGKEKIHQYAKAFGFGEKTGIDLPGEVSGWIRQPGQWSGTSLGAVSIGQEVAVTPLQVLRAYSSIANGGFLVKPRVVSKITDPEGRIVWESGPEARRVISAGTAATFREILKTVTEEGGTAKSAAVEGNFVAGKTGTAQVIDPRTKRYSREKYVSSFVGFVPADRPRIAMIVVIYEPRGQIYGGVVAAPVFKKIAENALSYLDVPREDAQTDTLVVAR